MAIIRIKSEVFDVWAVADQLRARTSELTPRSFSIDDEFLDSIESIEGWEIVSMEKIREEIKEELKREMGTEQKQRPVSSDDIAALDAWLRKYNGGFKFLLSLKDQLTKYGKLTPKQWSGVRNCKSKEKKAA